jgi:hypothetical protein
LKLNLWFWGGFSFKNSLPSHNYPLKSMATGCSGKEVENVNRDRQWAIANISNE